MLMKKDTKISNLWIGIKKIDFNKIWNLLFFLVLGWIFLLCLLDADAKYAFNPILIMFGIFASFLILTTIYKHGKKKLANMSNKSTWMFYIIITVIMMIGQVVIGYLVRTNPSWDLGLVIQGAQEIVQNGHATVASGYYVQAPNNIFITLLIAFFLNFFGLFGISNVNIITLITNIIFIQLAVLLLFKITKKVYGNFSACFVLILMFLFLPIYPYSTIMYTDTTSMFLPLAFLYLALKIKECKSTKQLIIFSVVVGVLCFLSFNLKVTALIVLIAFFINELIQGKVKQMATVCVCALCSFIVLQSCFITYIKKSNVIGIEYELTQQIPFTHFIMMGMYDTGAFSSEEWQFTLGLPDYETRKKEHLKVIKRRLENYRTQGYIRFLNKKVTGQTWGTGTYDFETILNSYAIDNNIAHKFLLRNGDYYKYVFYYCQIFHFTMLFFILISIFKSIKNGQENDVANIGKMSILGLLIFLLLWETRSRYMLNFIPIYLLIMFTGIAYASEKRAKIMSTLFLKNNK